MDQLPDEIILRILSLIAISEWQLLELGIVSKKLHRIVNDQTLWYQLFQQHYKNWGHHVPYTSHAPFVNWKTFVIHLAKQKLRTKSFTFDFVPDEISSPTDSLISRKRKLHELGRSSPSPPSSLKTLSRQQEPSSSSSSSFMDTTPDNNNNDNLLHRFGNHSTSANMMRMETDDMAAMIPPSGRRRPLLRRPRPSLLTSSMDEEPSFDRTTLRNTFDRPPQQFFIQDPLVVDLDRMKQTGMVATGKHRRATVSGVKQSEHKILFWEYPSWRLVRELELIFVPPEITCQVIGVQTVRIKKPPPPPGDADDCDATNYQSVRLFALAIGQPIDLDGHLLPDDPDANDDRVDLWQAVLIYRLHDDGTTRCLAHLPFDGRFMGREVFFFSDYSWTFGDSDDAPTPPPNERQRNVKEWLTIVAPEHTNYDPHFTLFMLAIGPTSINTDGCGKLIQFDLRGDANVTDPALSSVPVNPTVSRRPIVTRHESTPSAYQHLPYHHYTRYSPDQMALFSSSSPQKQQQHQQQQQQPWTPLPAKIIHSIHLGPHVSCMIHFRYPTHLNHLICTGSYDGNELSIYDWRFGIKVGTLPWKEEKQPQSGQPQPEQQLQPQPQQPEPQNLENNHPHQPQPQLPEIDQPPAGPPPPQEALDQPLIQEINRNIAETNNLQLRLVALLRMNRRGDFDHLAGEGGRDEFARRLAETIRLAGHLTGEVSREEFARRLLDTIRLIDQHVQQHQAQQNQDDDDDDDDLDFRHEVRPWGLEATMVLPPHFERQQQHSTSTSHGGDIAALADRGFRLIAVGDNRSNRLEIKVWDISFLLQQTWDPFHPQQPLGGDDDRWQHKSEWSTLFPWWQRGTPSLRILGLRMAYERAHWDERRYATSAIPFEIRRLWKHDPSLQQRATRVSWPFTSPRHHPTTLLSHAFDKPTPTTPIDTNDQQQQQYQQNPLHPMGSIMTVKYTAYNVLCTSLFLLTEDGKVTVMDIETGQVTGTIDNVAATTTGRRLTEGRIRGIDVNVVGGREVVVTSREGLLRSVMS